MNLRLILIACASALTAAAVGTACVTCNDIGCGGGFEWTGEAMNQVLTPGTYRLAITLDDDAYEVECEVAATYGESDCADPVHVSGDIDYALSVSLGLAASDDDWDPMNPVSGFELRAADTSESDDAGNFSATRGPNSVSIAIMLDGTELTTVDYDLEYDRDDNYRGDPACGYCDATESRTHEW